MIKLTNKKTRTCTDFDSQRGERERENVPKNTC